MQLYERRGFVACVEVIYLLALFALAILDLTPLGAKLGIVFPVALGPLPVGVPWFGALGAVVVSLSGVFDHRNDWDPTWAIWHFARPLIGVSLAIVAWLTFQAGILAVGSVPATPAATSTAPTNLLYYLIAFVVGYRETVFREMIKRVSDVILTPASAPGSLAPPAIGAIAPLHGGASGGDEVTIRGNGLSATTGVTFGSVAGTALRVNSDSEVLVTAPPGAPGPVSITLTTPSGTATGGPFVYG